MAMEERCFRYGRVLCLASREAGDISVLKAMGIDPRNIVAVDTDRDAVMAARERHPDVEVRNIDAMSAAERQKQPLTAAYLDFCGPISTATMEIVASVSRRIEPRGVLGVNVLKGRETGKARGMLDVHYRKDVIKNQMIGVGEAWGDREDIAMETWGRASTISSYVSEFCRDRFLFGIGEIRYQSMTDDCRGVPMFTGVYRVYPINRYRRRASLDRIGRETHAEIMSELIRDVVDNDVDCSSDEPPAHRNDVDISSDPDTCRLEVCQRLRGGENPALFNLTKQQAAALKAHVTMGTYEAAG